MADLADMIMQVYALESALLRARKLARHGARPRGCSAMTGLLADEAMALAEQAARRVLAACGEGDMLRTQLAILRRLARSTAGECGRAEPSGGAGVRPSGKIPAVRVLIRTTATFRYLRGTSHLAGLFPRGVQEVLSRCMYARCVLFSG